MDYKKISRTIRLIFAFMVALVLAFAIAVEFYQLPMEGALVDAFDAGEIYFVEVGMFFFTGISILLALKFFDRIFLPKVYEVKGKDKALQYICVYVVRLGLLWGLMLLGMLFYYGLLENWGLYYALAGFVSSFFCLPSAEGVEIELNMEERHNS